MESRVNVLYGSETGTAQDVSERLGRQAHHYGFRCRVMPMDDYPIAELVNETVVVFVCSTTGQGEEPDNMKRFWRFLLRKHLPNDCLLNLKCAVLGLGDSSYTKFNFAAKKLYKRLRQLGAEEIVSLGLADDQHDLGADAVVDEWTKNLWRRLVQLYCPHKQIDINGSIPIGEPKYKIDFTNEIQNARGVSDWGRRVDGSFSGRVVSNVRLTSKDHFQDVRLIKIDLTGSNMRYEPGDVAAVQPSNSQENVEEFFQVLNMDRDALVTVEQTNSDVPLPPLVDHSTSLKNWVRYYFDVQGVPRRYFFELLKYFGSSELENEKLQEFLSPEGQRDLYNYCHSARRSCLEVLRDFPNAAQSFSSNYLFDLFLPIKPRSFSIASESPEEIELLVAVVNYKTKLSKPRLGLCSTWMSNLRVGDEIPVRLKKGTFKFVYDSVTPAIMIGPGTGCAPFRSFLLRRNRLNLANNYLFFGNRNRDGDYFFQDEWCRMRDKGLLSLFTAFSRDQDRKIYVQHVMLEEKRLLWRLINEERANVYLAGNAKDMPRDVVGALLTIFETEGNMNEDEANAYFKRMELERKFQTETWS